MRRSNYVKIPSTAAEALLRGRPREYKHRIKVSPWGDDQLYNITIINRADANTTILKLRRGATTCITPLNPRHKYYIKRG